MRLALTPALIGLLAATALAPSAWAFTIENKDSDGSYTVPKFNLEEQAKQFSGGGNRESSLAPGKTDYSVPLGNGGTMSFGVQQGSAFGAPGGMNFGPTSPNALSQNSRQEFNRLTAPPNSMESLR